MELIKPNEGRFKNEFRKFEKLFTKFTIGSPDRSIINFFSSAENICQNIYGKIRLLTFYTFVNAPEHQNYSDSII